MHFLIGIYCGARHVAALGEPGAFTKREHLGEYATTFSAMSSGAPMAAFCDVAMTAGRLDMSSAAAFRGRLDALSIRAG
ncbi:hypothetical protein ABIF50_010321 [Bradyrhizobium diazoefficiens]|jgi:hypothetical protein